MHFSLHFFAATVLAIGFIITAGLGLGQAAIRSRSLPVCWHCGAREVRYSTSHRLLDNALWPLLLVPYRCWLCQTRFYGFRNSHSLNPAAPKQSSIGLGIG